ncbi:MAG: exodeoxyribonuclease III [Planctomycetota bacterium]
MNGIRAAEKRGFSDWLQRERPDFLCLQEMRAQLDQVPEELRSPAGYGTRWECAETKGYSGVGLYNRFAPDQYRVGSGLDWGDREGRVLRADYEELSIITIYVPSGSSSEERQQKKFEYMEHLLPWLQGLLDEGRPIAVCGDINIAHTEIDIHNPKGNAKNSGFLPEEREWFGRVLDQGWSDVLRDLNPDVKGLYSWWSNRGRAREKDLGWRIDAVWCSPQLAAVAEKAWIEKDAGLSDHAPVWVEFGPLRSGA